MRDKGVRACSVLVAARHVAHAVHDRLGADAVARKLRPQADHLLVAVGGAHASLPAAANTRRTRSAAAGTSVAGPILSCHGHQNHPAWTSTVSASIGTWGCVPLTTARVPRG